jgi:3-phosphoshikimate 1-carboxyvinyltransferase
MKAIVPRKPVRTSVTVPGSKSYTHRILIAAALSDGECTVHGALKSEDTLLTAGALGRLGVRIEDRGEALRIHGNAGRLDACDAPIDLGNSGTSMRFLTALTALGSGTYTLTGTPRMQQRPIQDLLDGLTRLGVAAGSVRGNGCPPVTVTGGGVRGGRITLDCSVSSQYLSGLLLVGPYMREGLEVMISRGPVSRPYIDLTIDVMQTLGVGVEREAYRRFFTPGGNVYRRGSYRVEPDASQAGYFWGIGAISGVPIAVNGIHRGSRQGDVRLTEVFERMGCRVDDREEGLTVAGGRLQAVDVDMADMPDMVPTLAVVAAFAEGTTRIRNVVHLRAKESDRLQAVVTELNKLGIAAACTDSGIEVTGGTMHGGRIATYDDHRIAMSFAMAGLRTPGVVIEDETCVRKSFPNFWEVFERL